MTIAPLVSLEKDSHHDRLITIPNWDIERVEDEGVWEEYFEPFEQISGGSCQASDFL